MSLWLFPQITMFLLVLPFTLVALYLFVLTIAACLHPDKLLINGSFTGKHDPWARFVILIPAHNEELLLGAVIRKLRGLSYPASHYEIAVIADNCDDKTADIAREAGAITLVRNDSDNRGKGQALNWAIKGPLAAWQKPWDALVVIDADSVVNPDFLWFMSERLKQGFQAMQAYYGVDDPSESWRSALMCSALSAFHFLRPLGRDRLGLPCGLKGNGMCFARRLVERFGYPATSVVEDVELALIYLREGIGVKFTPGAHVLGQMAATATQADTQRQRWEGGRLSLVSDWALPLWREGLKERNPSKVDAAVDLLIPPLTLLVVPTFLGWAIMLLITIMNPSLLSQSVFGIWSLVLLALIFYVVWGLILVRAPLTVWMRLSTAPLFVVWKMAVYLGMASKDKSKQTDWIRTERHDMK